MRVVAAPDKFRGSLTAPEVVAAAREGAEALGWTVIGRPLADGGEGMLDAFGGANRTSSVTGPTAMASTPLVSAATTSALRPSSSATASRLAAAGALVNVTASTPPDTIAATSLRTGATSSGSTQR